MAIDDNLLFLTIQQPNTIRHLTDWRLLSGGCRICLFKCDHSSE